MAKPAGLLLFHGAGGHRDHRLFIRLETELVIPVRRVNFAYRELGVRHPPPRAPKLIPEVAQAAESFGVEVDSSVAASALARFRAFFAFRFSALVRAGAKFASVVRAAAATEPFVD